MPDESARPRAFEAVLFDLDGTLADTALDLGYALNLQRARHGLPPMDAQTVRPHASHGTPGLLGIGFGISPDDASFRTLREEYLALYEANLSRKTRLFPGMETVLETLEQKGIRWGIVTNKPARFTLPLLEALNLSARAACVISGDTCRNAKPHPEPLLRAAQQLGADPARCLYVGDAERDAQAARAAGMPAIIAGYGYLGAGDQPERWGVDGILDAPADLLTFLP
ncbi:MAG: phosphoglycolate phosphatase [Betaproteobacteria bacterium]|nr:phosphoglycolate phosphatase [Betaproteobacteria bacterium]